MTSSSGSGNARDCTSSGAMGELGMHTLCLLVAVSLLLLSLGPMLDHHFAERHPGHSHIYLGSVVPDHSHSFESNHDHHSSRMMELLLQSGDNPTSDGVVVVSSNDGVPVGAAHLSVPMSLQWPRMNGGDGDGVPRLSYDPYETLSSSSVSPPRRPPRT